MIDLELLEKRGVSSAAWKKAFEAKTVNAKLEDFRRRAWARCNDGIDGNLKAGKHFYAVDLAWDSGFSNATPTLLRAFAKKMSEIDETKPENRNAVLNLVTDFGLRSSIITQTDSKTQLQRKVIDVPTFFNVTIPIVKGYTLIRAAKLCNDRDLDPFFKYEPSFNDPENRAKCEILTRRVQLTSTQYGYASVRRDAILKMLMYGVVLKFIQTEWDEERQLDASGNEKLVREGLTYHIPHPSRVYWDRGHSIYTLLTDTGCRFAGYWYLRRFGDVRTDPSYWNVDKLTMGVNWRTTNEAFFQTVYPCVMRFPDFGQTHDNSADLDRKYTSDFDDSAIMFVDHHEKIIPKDVGLGDYEYPVWAKLTFAGDGSVVYATPLPGVGVIPYADVFDASREINASFSMDLIPFQDSITNSLTAAVLGSNRNHRSLTLYDTNAVKPEIITQLENLGQTQTQAGVYIPYDGRTMRASQTDVRGAAVTPISFPQLNVAECLNVLNVQLNILERVMQISAQEVGATASHEQTVEEVTQTGQASSTRLQFTGTPIDWATDAWKRQIYAYLMANGEEEIYVQLPAATTVTRDVLEKMGFTVDEHDPKNHTESRYTVKGKKSALQLEYFASTKDDLNRTNQVEVAGAMSQIIMAIFKSPMLTEAIGPDQSVNLMNQILERMGLPRDFKLTNVGQGMAQQIMPMVQKLLADNQQQLIKEITPMAQRVQEDSGKIDKLGETVAKLAALVMHANQQPQEIPNGPEPSPVYPGASNPPQELANGPSGGPVPGLPQY